MGYIHHVENFHFWSSGLGDMELNNLGQGPSEMVKVIWLRCLAFNIFWQLHFQELSLYRYWQLLSVAL